MENHLLFLCCLNYNWKLCSILTKHPWTIQQIAVLTVLSLKYLFRWRVDSCIYFFFINLWNTVTECIQCNNTRESERWDYLTAQKAKTQHLKEQQKINTILRVFKDNKYLLGIAPVATINAAKKNFESSDITKGEQDHCWRWTLIEVVRIFKLIRIRNFFY